MGHALLLRPRQFAQPCVSADIWRSHLLHGKFPRLLGCPRHTLLEAHPMDALVMLTMCLSYGHHPMDGRMALPLTTRHGQPKLQQQIVAVSGGSVSQPLCSRWPR